MNWLRPVGGLRQLVRMRTRTRQQARCLHSTIPLWGEGAAAVPTPSNAKPEMDERIKRYWERRSDPLREKAMRNLTESVRPVDVSDLNTEAWISYKGHKMTYTMAKHDNVFADCFPFEFKPTVNLRVKYRQVHLSTKNFPQVKIRPVYRGNIMKPSKLQGPPAVKFDGDEGKLYTLMMISPDDCITRNDTNTLHWMKANIGHMGEGGDELCSYVPPTPPRGTGYHRYVFALFRQGKRIECLQGVQPLRPFDATRFMASEQLMPVGLAFMQCTWDNSVGQHLTSILGLEKEPSWE